MNKHLIFLLVAIVAVNAFVKRDAPKEGEKDLGEQLKDWATKTFDPETMKTQFNKAIDDVGKVLNAWTENPNRKS